MCVYRNLTLYVLVPGCWQVARVLTPLVQMASASPCLGRLRPHPQLCCLEALEVLVALVRRLPATRTLVAAAVAWCPQLQGALGGLEALESLALPTPWCLLPVEVVC